MKLARVICTGFFAFSIAIPAFAAEENLSSPAEVTYSQTGVGDLLVSIESSPLLGTTPRGAQRVEMAVINVSASCDADVILESIRLQHIGLGDVSDIARVYVYTGFRRASRARTFDRHSRTADVRVTSLTIPKCEAVQLKVLYDISPTASVASEHGVTIDSATSITSSAKTTTLQQFDSTKRIITSPKDAGSITANFLPIKGPLRYGRIETVARLQLTADSKNDHLLSSIVFTNLGDARDMNLIDFTLETRSGEVLSPKAFRMRGLRVTLDFDPTYILERSRTVVFLLKAKINASQSKKIHFVIQEPSDLLSTLYRPSR